MTKRERASWQLPDSDQETSNRSILRVQQLSNDLRDDLNSLPLFPAQNGNAAVTNILFVSRDHPREERDRDRSASPRAQSRTWYNFRLCDTYDFPCELVEWLMLDVPHDSDNSTGKPRKSYQRLQPLFQAAKNEEPTTRATFEQFEEALLNRQTKRALDQLLIALAVIPYNGVLVELFEKFFHLDKDQCRRPSCLLFENTGRDKAGNLTFEFTPFDLFAATSSALDGGGKDIMPPMRFPEDLDQFLSKTDNGSRSIFDLFVLPFTRGETPRLENDFNKAPFYNDDDSTNLHGFVIPAYDCFDDEYKWCGGMAGWVVAFLDHELIRSLKSKTGSGLPRDRRSQWRAFLVLVQSYVRDVRTAHMRDLVEDYTARPSIRLPDPEVYLREHLHYIIGWKSDMVAEKDEKTVIRIPQEQRTGKPLLLQSEPLPHTHWNLDRRFPRGTQRLCKLFLERLLDANRLREEGRMTEWEVFGHEMKGIAAALTGRWLVPPAEELEISGYQIAPIPELITGAGHLIYLWCPQGDIRDILPTYDATKPLFAQALHSIWTLCLHGILASLAKTRRLNKKGSSSDLLKGLGSHLEG